MASVFLSYDHEDLAVARPIASALEKAGHTVWYDRHIHGGAQYSRKIEQALDAADAVVVLWSSRSVESAWVRDEAAEGRDRGKLVPLSLGGVNPPMGFRQFQTIELGGWKGRGRVPNLAELLDGIRGQSKDPSSNELPGHLEQSRRTFRVPRPSNLALIAALFGILLAAAGAWVWLKPDKLPVVTVEAADVSSRSQAAASDLFVKLGSLAEIGQGKWQLADAETDESADADLIFRTADTGDRAQPKANLVLLDGKDDSLLWSREFAFPAGGDADLRQQLSLTAGRVLGCALESREAGGLRRDLLKLFLNACSLMVEASIDEPDKIARPLRTIVQANPTFEPAWARLLLTDSNLVDIAGSIGGDRAAALNVLKGDMESARRVVPGAPELITAQLQFLEPTAYEERLNLLAQAAVKAPDEPVIFMDQSSALQSVGRMGEAAGAARRAMQLDPLSPSAAASVVMTTAYAGQIEEARNELSQLERKWAGTGSLRDAQWAFHLRFGDPDIARRLASFQAEVLDNYLTTRKEPSPENIERLAAMIRRQPNTNRGSYGFRIQALAEFGRTDDLLRLIASTDTEVVAAGSYMLFRPAFKNVRRDPRFMEVARRVGLADYWLSTGQWPDFCHDPDIPYDCKAEAARRG